MLFAGYPCQPFSTAGRRKGSEDPRHLYPFIERAIPIIRPAICFFENVRGHVSCGLPEVIASLEGLGYRVRWGIYSAEETGAAHKRERVFILAILADTVTSGFWRFNEGGLQPQVISGCELADTIDGGSQNRRGECFESDVYRGDENNGSTTEKLCDCMGNSDNTGLQGRDGRECEECTCERITRTNGPFVRVEKFCVARPGEVPHEWERPRTISYAEETTESSLGLSAHGYRFREDILRALGNSVYEDTAELAFRDLLHKHGVTIESIAGR